MDAKIDTKEEFIKELRKELRWSCKLIEFKDIISDYEEFFQKELDNGQSEQEVCDDFGSPKEIVQKIKNEEQILKSATKLLENRAKTCLSILLVCLLTILYFFLGNRNGHTVRYHVIYTLIIPVLLWYILGGNYIICSMKDVLLKTNLCFVLHGLTVVLFAAFWLFNSFAIPYILREYPFGMMPSDVGSYIQIIFYVLAAFAAILAILGGYYFYQGKYYLFTVVCHSIGVFCSILMYGSTVRRIGILRNFNIMMVMLPYMIGILETVVIGLYIKKSKGKL